MERVMLNVEVRSDTGKSAVKKLRTKGIIPGVVYAKDTNPIQIKTDGRELVKLLHCRGGNVIIDLKLRQDAATEDKMVIIKDIQYDSLKGNILHVDFQQIKLTENIRVQVPLVTKGDADTPGVKEGGILERILREVEVECLPTKIPKEIIIDVSNLAVGQAVHIGDLSVPEGVKVITDPQQIAVLIKIEAEEKPAEEKPAEEEITEPEVIKQKKREEEGEKTEQK